MKKFKYTFVNKDTMAIAADTIPGLYLCFILLGHLGKALFYQNCCNAQPGDRFYQRYTDYCLSNPQAELKRSKELVIKTMIELNTIQRGCLTAYIRFDKRTNTYEHADAILEELFHIIDVEKVTLGHHWYDWARDWAQENMPE